MRAAVGALQTARDGHTITPTDERTLLVTGGRTHFAEATNTAESFSTLTGFSRPLPSLLVLAAYGCSMLLLSKVVQTIPLGVTYALWSGIGIVAIVLVGVLAYKQVPTPTQLWGMAMISAGVIVVNLSGQLHE